MEWVSVDVQTRPCVTQTQSQTLSQTPRLTPRATQCQMRLKPSATRWSQMRPTPNVTKAHIATHRCLRTIHQPARERSRRLVAPGVV